MEQYIGVKIIHGKPMTRGDYNKFKGWTIPADENPDDEGYLVKYNDDYISWSPKVAFIDAYRRINNMTFGLAVEAAKKGCRICRKGWNGKGMWLRIVIPGGDNTEFDMGMENLPYFELKTVDNKLVPWQPSQTDILAEDWMIVEQAA